MLYYAKGGMAMRDGRAAGSGAYREGTPRLTLKAVVLDIGRTGPEEPEAEALKADLAANGIINVMAAEPDAPPRARYASVKEALDAAGIERGAALLLTEDERLADYVMREKEDGMAVVFYERGGRRTKERTDLAVQGLAETDARFFDRVQKRRQGIPWDILCTERTYVREIALADLDELYGLYEGKGITDYTEPLFERAEEEAYTRSYIDCMYRFYGYGMWIVRDRFTGELIGRVGIEHREMGDAVCMELGYIIASDRQNKGYATEVCRAVLDYAKEVLEMRELHCFIDPRNHASIRVAQKLGFARAGVWEEQGSVLLHYQKDL